MGFYLTLYRMAARYTCDDVVQLVTGNAWDFSEGESEDEIDFELDLLDREQAWPVLLHLHRLILPRLGIPRGLRI